jgi:hypothetical protein
MSHNRNGYVEHLGNFWFPNGINSLVWLLFSLPALYFFHTVVHEGSHGMAALFASGTFPKFAPFPHYNTHFDGFVNGVAFTGGRGFVATPQFVALGLIVVFTLISLFWPIRNHFERFALRTWYLGSSIDLLYNTSKGLWGGSSPSSDWGKLQAQTSTAGIIVLTWVIWLVVLSHFLWVNWSAWGRNKPARAGFWNYRWAALTLGLLSLAAILFAAIVSDPSIQKDHVFFIAPLVVQVLALIWIGTYLPLSFYYTS